MIIIILLIWIPFCLVAGSVAKSRGHSFLAFFLLSIVLSPLLGIAIALIMPSGSRRNPSAETSLPPLPGPSAEFRTGWTNLSRYDPDISAAVEHLSRYGNEAVLRFRDIYATVNNKAAIPGIVSDVENYARSIADPSQWVPSGFKKSGSRAGVSIYHNGPKHFWAAGEHFRTVDEAIAYAHQLTGKAPQNA